MRVVTVGGTTAIEEGDTPVEVTMLCSPEVIASFEWFASDSAELKAGCRVGSFGLGLLSGRG